MPPNPFAWTLAADEIGVVALLAAAYALALRRYRASGARRAAFATGLALVLATAVTPLHALSFHLLTAHLLQNVVLAEWAPALLVLGLPPALAAALAGNRAVRELTRPPVALALWLAVYAAWHVPALYDAALRHPHSLLHLEHACYLAAGVLLWWPVLQDAPWQLAPQLRAAYLLAAFLLASPVGLLLTFLPEPVYSFYDGFEPWAMSALTDQRMAGVTMAAEQGVVFFAVFSVFFLRFLAAEEARS